MSNGRQLPHPKRERERERERERKANGGNEKKREREERKAFLARARRRLFASARACERDFEAKTPSEMLGKKSFVPSKKCLKWGKK
jgi:hypothetical protein